MNDLRNPKQKRAIDKKEKIIDAGFDLICKKGYHYTNTKEIAQIANVSTGIVYQYFKDKHDIFIAGIEKYANHIFFPMLNINNITFNKKDLPNIINKIVNDFILNHKLSANAHSEIMSLVHSDESVAYFYHKREMDLTNELTTLFIKNKIKTNNLKEKVHIIIGLIDNLCHELVYHKHSELNYNDMTKIVIQTIDTLLLK